MSVYLVGTMDSKGEELAYVGDRLRERDVSVRLIDVGTQRDPALTPDVTRQEVAAMHPSGPRAVLDHDDRGQAVTAMSEALVRFVQEAMASGEIDGMLGLGGSGGTALIAPAMRALPIGVPKLLLSTVASGNTAPYVDCCDLTMMYSVVDVAGLNRVSRRILANAADAMAGMVTGAAVARQPRRTVGLTMFGVTTPCVTAARQALEADGYECLVFHATGAGGRAMEKLVEGGQIDAVIDLTTTEVADEVVGGVFAAGPQRFDRILAARVPFVLSLGALDMVNFGAEPTVPERFRGRKLHVHNAQVTLMRTTPEENRAFGQWIAGKLNQARSPFTLLIPEKGVSLIDAPGQPFHDPRADAALFETLEREIEAGPGRVVRRVPHHINDPAFAEAAVAAFVERVNAADPAAGGRS